MIYTAIYCIDLGRDFQMMEMKNEEAKLYPVPKPIRAFRRLSATSEN